MIRLVVLLEPGVWLADGQGDPPRVTVVDNARIFDDRRVARLAISSARRWRPFTDAAVIDRDTGEAATVEDPAVPLSFIASLVARATDPKGKAS